MLLSIKPPRHASALWTAHQQVLIARSDITRKAALRD